MLWAVTVLLLPLAGVAGVFAAVAVLIGGPLVVLVRRARHRPRTAGTPTVRQERRLAVSFAAVMFALTTVGDPHKTWGGWLWDVGVAVGGSLLAVAVLRRSPHFKESRFVKLSFAMFVLILATDAGVTAARGWREPVIMTRLLVAAVSIALVAMLVAGREPLRVRRRNSNA